MGLGVSDVQMTIQSGLHVDLLKLSDLRIIARHNLMWPWALARTVRASTAEVVCLQLGCRRNQCKLEQLPPVKGQVTFQFGPCNPAGTDRRRLYGLQLGGRATL